MGMLIVAILFSTAMAVARLLVEPMKQVKVVILSGTFLTVTLAAAFVIVAKGSVELMMAVALFWLVLGVLALGLL